MSNEKDRKNRKRTTTVLLSILLFAVFILLVLAVIRHFQGTKETTRITTVTEERVTYNTEPEPESETILIVHEQEAPETETETKTEPVPEPEAKTEAESKAEPAPEPEAVVEPEVQPAQVSGEFEVVEIRFSESAILTAKQLEDIEKYSIENYKGLDALTNAVNQINRLYDELGYRNAFAYIPDQESSNGVFYIELAEGVIAEAAPAEAEPAPEPEAVVEPEVQPAQVSGEFEVVEIRFSESAILTAKQLEDIEKYSIENYKGLDALTNAVDQINRLYDELGYRNAFAYIPDQESSNGVFFIELAEGIIVEPVPAEAEPAPEPEAVPEAQPAQVSGEFEVVEIRFSESAILTAKQLEDIEKYSVENYKGLDALTNAVNQINRLYDELGYRNAFAYIPDQESSNGVFYIELVEAIVAVTSVPVETEPEVEPAQVSGDFEVIEIRFSESAILTAKQLEDIEKFSVENYKGLDALTNAVDKVNRLYDELGYRNAYAYLPDQESSNGVFYIELAEGIIAETAPAATAPAEAAPAETVPAAAEPAEVKVAETKPATEAAAKPNETFFSVDSYGKRAYGSLRFGAGTIRNNLIKLNDTLNIGFYVTKKSLSPYADFSILIPKCNILVGLRGTYGETLDENRNQNGSVSLYLNVPVLNRESAKIELSGNGTYSHSTSEAGKVTLQGGLSLTASEAPVFFNLSANLTKALEILGSSYSYSFLDGNAKLKISLPAGFYTVLKGGYQVLLSGEGLPASAMFFLGGNSTVRGYEESCAQGNYGANASAEIHFAFEHASIGFDLSVFTDYGYIVPQPDTNENSLWSIGAGVQFILFKTLTINVAGALPQINLSVDPHATEGRIFFSAVFKPELN